MQAVAFKQPSLILPSAKNNKWNLLKYSEEFDNSGWVMLAGLKNLQPNSVPCPTGQFTADKITFDNINDAVTQTYVVKILAADTFTGSIYCRNLSGSINLQIARASGGAYEVGTAALVAGSAWQRVSITYAFVADQLSLRLEVVAASLGASVEIWGAQLVPGPYMLDYQKTT